MKKTNKYNLIYILLVLLGCSKNDISENTNDIESINIAIESQANNNINLSYNIKNISENSFLIYSKSGELDYQNYENIISLNNNSGTISVGNLTFNTTYYFKVFYLKNNTPKYSNQTSATTKEIVFNLTTNTTVNILPESGNFIYLMDSELDESKNYLYLLTRQLSQYRSNNEKVELTKIGLQGNILWKTLIQNFQSFTLGSSIEGHKIQLLSDGNIAIITTKESRNIIMLTKISQIGNLIWQKEIPVNINYNNVNFNVPLISGYSYKNDLIKIIVGSGKIYSAEETFINNKGEIIEQNTITTSDNDEWISNAKYLDDETLINIGGGDLHPNDALVSYDGLIQKFTISSENYQNIWIKLYGEYGGDDYFEKFIIKNNFIYINGHYGNTSGSNEKQKWVIKFDNEGDIIWEHKSPIKNDFIYQGKYICVSDNGDLLSLMHEIYYPRTPIYDITTLTKYNNNGDLIWIYVDGEEFNTERFTSNKVFEINNTDYIITGNNSENVGSVWIKRIRIE